MEVLVESYQGKPLVAPNDVTIDGKGRLYFTDPGGVAVYRIDGNGQVARILAAPDIQRPNGIQISPDDKQLYLIEANNTEGGARMIRAYDLGPDGAVANIRVHYNFYPGRSADGMSIDTQGNLYASAGMNQLRGTSETLDTKTVVQNPDRDYRTSALAWLVPPAIAVDASGPTIRRRHGIHTRRFYIAKGSGVFEGDTPDNVRNYPELRGRISVKRVRARWA
jgi:sugar lactone lactonase YvrE